MDRPQEEFHSFSHQYSFPDLQRFEEKPVRSLLYKSIAHRKKKERSGDPMAKKILIPTDFSDYARLTADLVPEIPDIGEVIVLSVVEGGNPSFRGWLAGQEMITSLEYAERSLKEEVQRLKEKGIASRGELLTADGRDTSAVILSFARKESVDLIIIGARGKGIVEGFLLGSVSTAIIRHTITDVLLTRHRSLEDKEKRSGNSGSRLFSRVLFPVDFSKPCEEGLEYLRGFSGMSELVLVNVITSAGSREGLEQGITEAYQQLRLFHRSFDDGKAAVKILIRFGKPAEIICALAEEEDTTLIFMPRFGASDYIKSLPIGSTAEEVVRRAKTPLFLFYPHIELETITRELAPEEFAKAETVWEHYHQQKADPESDRIFGVFVEGTLVSVARCRRHPDGLEVDGVFTLDEFRGRGYAGETMKVLIAALGNEVLYMHSTLQLIDFYGHFGFRKIGEDELPAEIKARFEFAMGELQGANVQPMKRIPMIE
jgi:nucleotide-binding universal stress UspA family protein